MDIDVMMYGMMKMWTASEDYGLTPQEFFHAAIRGQEFASNHPPFWEKPQYGDL